MRHLLKNRQSKSHQSKSRRPKNRQFGRLSWYNRRQTKGCCQLLDCLRYLHANELWASIRLGWADRAWREIECKQRPS
jgi:hypothetical protein